LTPSASGYGSGMKIPFGFALGFVTGAFVYSKLTEEQRAGIADSCQRLATTGRTGRLATTLRRGVGEVADVATERVADVTETVTDAAASAISSDDPAAAAPFSAN
jgi:hypothetical protein